MRKLVMATSNKNKIIEISKKLDNEYNFLSLDDIVCNEEIPETSDTIEGNALQKALYVFENYGYDCFAEDTGLEIEALNSAPGVYTARYAGESKDPDANMDKVLFELKKHKNRKARFKTVIALILNGKQHFFEGIVNGTITESKEGEKGFGYDPIFKPDGFDRTYAQMSIEEKNIMSHRALAVDKLKKYLDSIS